MLLQWSQLAFDAQIDRVIGIGDFLSLICTTLSSTALLQRKLRDGRQARPLSLPPRASTQHVATRPGKGMSPWQLFDHLSRTVQHHVRETCRRKAYQVVGRVKQSRGGTTILAAWGATYRSCRARRNGDRFAFNRTLRALSSTSQLSALELQVETQRQAVRDGDAHASRGD